MKMKKISVILPVYNESACIHKTFDSVVEFSKKNPAYHFIFVNDGSTDDTQKIIHSKIEQSKTSQIALVNYNTNKGKGYAVKKGLEYSDGDYICFIDSDLAYSLAHLELIVDKLEVFDVVIGCRNFIPDSVNKVKFKRKVAGKVFNLMSRKILSLKFRDMQAGVKGFRKYVAKYLFEKQTMTRFAFDVELIYLAKKQGYTIGEIPAIISDMHMHKASKVDLLKDSIEMFYCLLKIKYNDTVGKYE